MGGVLTIIAKSPNNEADPDPNNGTLDKIIENFTNAQIPFQRAATVRDIATIVKAQDLDVVQIVGHGEPGKLALGESWTKTYANNENYAYSIDSNPYQYSLLVRWIHPRTHIVLVGCWVGDDDSTKSYVDGTTLLFDLARMRKGLVSAALCAVTPSDFHDGIFKGPVRSSNGVTGACAIPTKKPASARLQFHKLSRVNTLGPFNASPDRLISPQQSMRLSNIYTYEVQLGDVLAYPELEFEVSVGGGPKRHAVVYHHGRYVRVYNGPSVQTFTVGPSLGPFPGPGPAPQPPIDDARKELMQLVRVALPAF